MLKRLMIKYYYYYYYYSIYIALSHVKDESEVIKVIERAKKLHVGICLSLYFMKGFQ